MKNYFNFNLTGKKLFPVWILFLLLFIAPYCSLIFSIRHIQLGTTLPLFFFPLIFLLLIVAFAIAFYIIKLTIENIAFKDKSIVFNGSFGKFIGTLLLGYFLSIITLGIYIPWFIKDLHRFFIDNSSYNEQPFKFKGQGGKLFVIILLTLILPMIVLGIVMVTMMISSPTMINDPSVISNPSQTFSFMLIQQLVTMIIFIPNMYLVYKWAVNVEYGGLNISWETDFFSSCGKIAIEMFLSIITLGIYAPLAMLKLYKYFVDRTIASSNDRKLKFGYDMDPSNDFLFMWGQILLIIITFGIYYPWAFCKIGNRILGKIYLAET